MLYFFYIFAHWNVNHNINQLNNNIMNTFNFELIYAQNYNTVYRYCISKLNSIEVAEEVANDVFIKLERHLTDGLYNPDKCAIKTYIFTICNCGIIDYLRANKDSNRITNIENFVDANGNEFFTIEDKALIISERIVDNEFNNKIQKAFSKLNELQQKVAELYFIKEMKYIEIAEICNISMNSVKVNIFRAREVLQKELAKVKKEYCR